MKAEVLKFYAKWCAPCKRLSPITKEIAEENPDVKFTGVNIDDSNVSETMKKHSIKSIPTLIFLKNGQEVDRIVGGASKKEIEERVFLLQE